MRCSISATVALAVASLLLIVSAPSVSPNEIDNIENMEQLADYLEQLQSTVDNLDIDIGTLFTLLSALENQLGELTENAISGLSDDIADLLAQLGGLRENTEVETAALSEDIADILTQLEEFRTSGSAGASMVVYAITDNGIKPLTLTPAAISGGGFKPVTVEEGDMLILWILNSETQEPVPSGSVELIMMPMGLFGGGEMDPLLMWMLMQQGGFGLGGGFSMPITNGMAMVPVMEGMGELRMGTVHAEYYRDAPFFFRVGEVTDETPPTEHIYFTTVATMKVGEPNVLRAVDQAGKVIVGTTIRIQDPDADPQLQEGLNPLSFVPGSESFTVSLMRDGEEIAVDTLQVPKQKGGGEPWGAVIGVSMVILVVYFAYRYKIKGKGLWWKRGKKPPLG